MTRSTDVPTPDGAVTAVPATDAVQQAVAALAAGRMIIVVDGATARTRATSSFPRPR